MQRVNLKCLDLDVTLSNGKFTTDQNFKSTDRHQYLHYPSLHPGHTKRLIFAARYWELTRYVPRKVIFERI